MVTMASNIRFRLLFEMTRIELLLLIEQLLVIALELSLFILTFLADELPGKRAV
jgi:hypothetical protein